MLINVIALGESASKWNGSGYSIGVNDAYRWGHKLNILALLNASHEFTPEERDYIRATNADTTFTCYRDWLKFIQSKTVLLFDYSVWQGQLCKDAFQTSNTSPFCAISIAYNLGYDEIVLWGVDFKSHPIYHSKNPNYYTEIKNYQDLAARLKEKGITIYHCEEKNVFGFPVYENKLLL